MKTNCVCLIGEGLVTVNCNKYNSEASGINFDTSTNILLKATVTKIDLIAFNYLNDCRL